MQPDLYERLRLDLRVAIAARDSLVVRTLRTAISAIDNARAVEVEDTGFHVGHSPDVPRRELDHAAMCRVIEREILERREAATELAGLGAADDAARLEHEIEVLTKYLEPAGEARSG